MRLRKRHKFCSGCGHKMAEYSHMASERFDPDTGQGKRRFLILWRCTNPRLVYYPYVAHDDFVLRRETVMIERPIA